uniref:LIM zinc-binding domain-containing protein n=1 Tax=Ciona savignyi TaxID=51511 RepID=H2YHJ9_CIOSA
MNPPCARCKKTVYPTEKLNCLDKMWHKSCFTCETCNLKLTMKTYKGYNKLPYCNTHYPTTKFTAVSDTPENKRLAQQQKNQSELQYRKVYRLCLGFTQVADTVSNRTGNIYSYVYFTAPHEVGRHGEVLPENIVNRRQVPGPTHVYAPPKAPQEHISIQQLNCINFLLIQNPQVSAPALSKSPTLKGDKYKALFDYLAADADEVSFKEGDIVVDVTIIDDGWMEGRVVRTGAYGMMPSNYVEQV